MTSYPVCVKGHADATHCGPMVRATGSTNVFVNRLSGAPAGSHADGGISREDDPNTFHKRPPNIPPCPGHTVGIKVGSLKVRVNSKGCGRIFDATCTHVAEGSANVRAG